MKLFSLIFGAFITASWPAQSQLLLQPGDSYSYQFSTLPQVGLVNFGEIGGRLTLPTMPPFNSALNVEFFENDFTESPVASIIYPIAGTLPPYPPPIFSAANIWQDLQGAVRISVTPNSTVAYQLNQFQLSVFRPTEIPGPSGPRIGDYSLFVQVPEPSALSLLSTCAGLGGLMFLYKNRRS